MSETLTSPAGLPHAPESIEALRARFAAAQERVWEHSVMLDAPRGDRPGLHRVHVFDGADAGGGWRLIISRERMRDGEHVLHVSSSFERKERAGAMETIRLFEAVAGVERLPTLRSQFVTQAGVTHVVFAVPAPRSEVIPKPDEVSEQHTTPPGGE